MFKSLIVLNSVFLVSSLASASKPLDLLGQKAESISQSQLIIRYQEDHGRADNVNKLFSGLSHIKYRSSNIPDPFTQVAEVDANGCLLLDKSSASLRKTGAFYRLIDKTIISAAIDSQACERSDGGCVVVIDGDNSKSARIASIAVERQSDGTAKVISSYFENAGGILNSASRSLLSFVTKKVKVPTVIYSQLDRGSKNVNLNACVIETSDVAVKITHPEVNAKASEALSQALGKEVEVEHFTLEKGGRTFLSVIVSIGSYIGSIGADVLEATGDTITRFAETTYESGKHLVKLEIVQAAGKLTMIPLCYGGGVGANFAEKTFGAQELDIRGYQHKRCFEGSSEALKVIDEAVHQGVSNAIDWWSEAGRNTKYQEEERQSP